MNPDTWVKLLYTYGPFALLVFFFVVGETRARSALKDPQLNKKVTVTAYAANWVAIFILLGFAVSAWYRLNFNTEFTIRGQLQNLQGSETVASNSSELFLRRRYGPGGHFDYEWRLITLKPLIEGDTVPFVMELGTAESEKLRSYELPIFKDYYGTEVAIIYDRQKDKLFLRCGAHQQELRPVDTEAHGTAPAGTAPPQKSYFVWKVEAQSMSQPAPLKDRLEAGDPIIRKDARQELAQQQGEHWQFVENTLADKKSSYRVKVGILSALNSNSCQDVPRLSPPALDGVIDASGDLDVTLRNLARRCLVAKASPSIDSEMDKLTRTSSSSIPNKVEFVKTHFEVLYQLGVQAKDRYGSRQARDRTEFDRAVGYFQKAWELRTDVPKADRIVFAKALYGWGLALHDRSWIERDAHQRRIDTLTHAAQGKFSEFLTQVRAADGGQSYPFPEHLRRAEEYVQRPEPQSLELN